MPRMIGTGLSRREREILDILNRLGSATAAQIEAEMRDSPTNSAIRSTLRIMKDKGYLRVQESGRQYIYHPTVARPAAARSALHGVIETFFQGSLSGAVTAFLSDADMRLSDDDLDKLVEAIEQARRGNSGRNGDDACEGGAL